MGLYDIIKELAAKKRVSIRKMEEDLGYSNGTVRRWNKFPPNTDKINEVSTYFHVSPNFLLGRKDEIKAQKVDLEMLAESENWDDWLSAGGKPLTESDKKLLKAMFGDD